MKTKHIFWGLFFVTIGILILLSNLNSINIDLSNIWKFWPLVIILWGISFFSKNTLVKTVIAGISAIILALAIFAFFYYSCNFVCNSISDNDDGFSYSINDNSDTSNYSTPYNSAIKNCEFNLNAGAGSFKINDSTEELMEAVTRGVKNKYELTRSNSGDNTILTLDMKKRHFNFFDGHNKNETLIKLNPSPAWNLNFELGAASTYFDLSPFKTKDIEVKMGAASFKTKLGSKSEITNLHLKAGVSSIEISVPESSGCEITCSAGLSSKDFDDFTKINSNLYRTNNFDSAKKKIYLNLETGISSIHVTRYGSD
jgi:hypothetical protein